MNVTTIRSILVSLIGSLGALVLLLLVLQLYDLNNQSRQAEDQFASNQSRNQLVQVALALAREREARFLALSLDRAMPPEASTQTDQNVAAVDGLTENENQDVDPMAVFTAKLLSMRQTADAAMGLPVGSANRQDAAAQWFDSASSAVVDLLSLRIKLLSQTDNASPTLFGLYYLRTQTLILLDELMKNAVMIEVDIAQATAAGATAQPNAARFDPRAVPDIMLTVSQFKEILGTITPSPEMNAFDFELYTAAELRLGAALDSGLRVENAVIDWRRISADAIQNLADLQASTSKLTQNATKEQYARTKSMFAFWAAVLLASIGVVAVAIRVVLHSVVGPLERMRDAMLQLADDNFAVVLPKKGRLAEIDAMDDALRVFKANGIRRQNIQKERLRLHGRLEETYSLLKTDLEAAAVIQASLLPQQAQLAGVSLSSYFRPSHFLAGDTFDVLQQPDGRVIVFQIDVAGHGAAAALVSVASKYTVAQAILQRQPGTDLAVLTEQINREWPGDLPYFTLLLAEIDPATGKGSMVQAGHPSPLLLRASGELTVLGDGGLPVGVLASATFDLIHFAFGHHDRLIVMTDGVHEMADRNGELFSEERVQDLIRAAGTPSTEHLLTDLDTALRAWRGDDTLDDDVTIVILEGKRNHERP